MPSIWHLLLKHVPTPLGPEKFVAIQLQTNSILESKVQELILPNGLTISNCKDLSTALPAMQYKLFYSE